MMDDGRVAEDPAGCWKVPALEIRCREWLPIGVFVVIRWRSLKQGGQCGGRLFGVMQEHAEARTGP
jgi:hypothetical protein